MGACFNEMEVDGKATKDEVLAEFNARCEQDGWESGHSYSGSFSQFHGLVFSGKEFGSYEEAETYVEEHGEKWGPAVCVKYTKVEPSKRMQNLGKQIQELRQKIWNAESKLRNAQQKMRINNRSTEPAYVKTARTKLEQVMVTVNPKIAAKEAKRKEIEQALAAKSKKSRWLMGGWCSS